MNMPELLDHPIPLDPPAPAPLTLAALPRTEPLAPAGRVPLALLGAVGEQIAATASALMRGQTDPRSSVERLEAFGLQLQEVAKVAGRAQQLRREPVDLGLALLQTLAEWSAEASRLGVELHGPACSVEVHANPAALKHLLDLLLEHALQQGGAVRFEIESPPGGFVRVIAQVDTAPVTPGPLHDTLAWQLLVLVARALSLAPQREPSAGGERLTLPLPRA